MKITKNVMTKMYYGTKEFKIEGVNLNEEELEKLLESDAPFGFSCRINAEKTKATCTCYYD